MKLLTMFYICLMSLLLFTFLSLVIKTKISIDNNIAGCKNICLNKSLEFDDVTSSSCYCYDDLDIQHEYKLKKT